MLKIYQFLKEIQEVDEVALRSQTIPTMKCFLRDNNVEALDFEKLVYAVQKRFKQTSDHKPSIRTIRQMLYTKKESLQKPNDFPEWTKNWLYVSSHGGYLNTENYQFCKSEAFNAINGKFVDQSESGKKMSATKYVADNGFVGTVDRTGYYPFEMRQVFMIDKTRVFNTFKPFSIPVEATEYTAEGLKTIDLIVAHITMICSTHERMEILLQWLAYQVQFMGQKILWSPVIQSIEGVGKSFFGVLLRICLGDENVGTVSPNQVSSNFNGWATNRCVNVLEEMRIVGQNRYDIANALKPLVTDEKIQINDKGVSQYVTHNTTNYICFTNFKDAIPLTKTDRRWWVVFAQLESLDEIKDYTGYDKTTYFPMLFDLTRQHAGEIRKWLLEYPISEDFMNLKQAPMTDEKLSMIATEEIQQEGFHELQELINNGGQYWNKSCVSSSDLFLSFMLKNVDITLNNHAKNALLKKLGYTVLPHRLWLDGKPRTIWTKVPMTEQEVLRQLQR